MWEKINRIKKLNAACNILFITDQHSGYKFDNQKRCLDLVGRLAESLPLDCIVSGGDLGNDYAEEKEIVCRSYLEMMARYEKMNAKVLCCIGNHDDATGVNKDREDMADRCFLPEELHRIMQEKSEAYAVFDSENPYGNYFYYDIDRAKIRVIGLNTSDIDYVRVGNRFTQNSFDVMRLSRRQLDWVEQAALNTDYRCVFFSHAPLINDGIAGVSVEPGGGRELYERLTDRERVIGVFSGHVHYDNLVAGRLPRITTLCAFSVQWGAGPERCIGQESEFAFDVISIASDRVYLTRFGAGENREYLLEEER